MKECEKYSVKLAGFFLTQRRRLSLPAFFLHYMLGAVKGI